MSVTSPPQTTNTNTNSTVAAPPSEASAKLAEALDDFLLDVEKKFKTISDEILTKLDDMAERCDRLEQEMLMRDGGSGVDTRSKSTLQSGSGGESLADVSV